MKQVLGVAWGVGGLLRCLVWRLDLSAQSQLADVLLRAGVLNPVQLEQVFQEQAQWGGRFSQLIVEMGLIREEHLVGLLSQELRLPIATMERLRQVPKEALTIVPALICEQYGLLPIGMDVPQKRLLLAMSDPTEESALQEIRKRVEFDLERYTAPASAIRRAIRFHFYGEGMAEAVHPSGYFPEVGTPGARPGHPGVVGAPPLKTPHRTGAFAGIADPYTTGLRPPGLGSSAPPLTPRQHRPGVPTGSQQMPAAPVPGGRGVPPARQGWGRPGEPRLGVPPGGMGPHHHPASLELDAATEAAIHKEEATRAAANAAALATAERNISDMLTELHKMRNDFQQFREQAEQELDAVQSLVRSRFQEQRLLMRGLFDLLVARGFLSKEELVHMLNKVSEQQDKQP